MFEAPDPNWMLPTYIQSMQTVVDVGVYNKY